MIPRLRGRSSSMQGARYCVVRPRLANKKALEANSSGLRCANACRRFERSVPKACKSNSRKCGERLKEGEDFLDSEGSDWTEPDQVHLSTGCSALKPNFS